MKAPGIEECPTLGALKSYLSGDSAPDDVRLIENHIEECEACEHKLQELLDDSPALFATTLPSYATQDNNVPDTAPLVHRYACFNLIDKGAFGLVWKMRDLHFNRFVAIKVMKARDVGHEELKRRFFAEAQICSQLTHPNIVPIHDMGELPDGRGFYAMKLVEGDRLDQSSYRGLGLVYQLQVFENICQGMAFAHENKVIHRDLKPANIMLGQHGEIQIMDWGLAKVVNLDSVERNAPVDLRKGVQETSRLDSDRTTRGAMGTYAYMAPEQAVDAQQATFQSDVYSMGVILFEMLTGQRFRNQAMTDSSFETPDRLFDKANRQHMNTLDIRLQQLIEDCVTFSPSSRPVDAGAVLQQVVSFRNAVSRETEEQKVQHERQQAILKEARKKRRLWIALSVALTIGMAGTSIAAYFMNVARKDAEIATKQAEDSAKETQRLANNRNDVIQFLTTNVFGKADPWKEPDRELTFREVLDMAMVDAKEMQSDPEVKAEILIELGKVYFNLGETKESLQLFSQAETIGEERLKPDHRLYMTSLDQKGMVLLQMEDFSAAERVLQKATELQTKVLGPNHEDTIHSLAKLGDLYSNWGKPQQAISITQDVLNRRKKFFGSKYRFTLVSMNGLALLYGQVGESQKAIDLLREAHRIAQEVEGPESTFTTSYANNLALMLIDVDKLEEAESLARHALSVANHTLDPSHGTVFAYRHTISRIQFARERYQECLTECESMLTDFPSPSVRHGVVIYLKAKSLKQLDRQSEAVLAASAANKMLIDILGEDHRFQREILDFLAELP